jgi:hypothetical protein
MAFLQIVESFQRITYSAKEIDESLLYTFVNEERKNALPWQTEVSDTIELNWVTMYIMIYFNWFHSKMSVKERDIFYRTLEAEIPSMLYKSWDNRGTFLKDEIIDYTLHISHEIPTEEVGNLVKTLLKLGCKLGPVSSELRLRALYGY